MNGAEPGQCHALPEGTLNPDGAPDCQVPPNNAAISRRQPPSRRHHAELQMQGDEVRLRDLDSVDGS